ncbi:hypothetical protein NMY22_g12953 [Coprinellus aureogranulatus]|nr:hypothetical protein NMY22_g12953 [Coprinellus aureogranulatus]
MKMRGKRWRDVKQASEASGTESMSVLVYVVKGEEVCDGEERWKGMSTMIVGDYNRSEARGWTRYRSATFGVLDWDSIRSQHTAGAIVFQCIAATYAAALFGFQWIWLSPFETALPDRQGERLHIPENTLFYSVVTSSIRQTQWANGSTYTVIWEMVHGVAGCDEELARMSRDGLILWRRITTGCLRTVALLLDVLCERFSHSTPPHNSIDLACPPSNMATTLDISWNKNHLGSTPPHSLIR